MGYMNTEIMNKLDALLKEWIKAKYKSNNPTGTYSEGTLIEFMEEIANWTFQWYSAEAKEVMPTETQESYDEWLEQNIDRLAEEDLEYQTSIKGAHNYKKHKLN